MGPLKYILFVGLGLLTSCTIVVSSTPCDPTDGTTGSNTTDSGDTGSSTPVQVARVAAGGHHTCWTDADGAVECAGFDGDMGVVSAAPLTGITSLVAGYLFTCAAGDDGLPVCWGDDRDGQTLAPAVSVESLVAGGAHGCGVEAGVGVVCWGRNTEGQANPPAALGPDIALLAAGWLFSCAAPPAAAPVCWGWDAAGEVSDAPIVPLSEMALGDGFGVGVPADGSALLCWGDAAMCGVFDGSTPLYGLVAGADFFCGLDDAGEARCQGTNANGVLTDAPVGPFSSLAAGPGGRHVCGVRPSTDVLADVVCWGADTAGQVSWTDGE